MTDYAWVVRKGDKYLMASFHRQGWTKWPSGARTFTDETTAQAVAVKVGGEVRVIEMKETD